jgi:C4-dicarboxylate transporter DctM subunit
MLLILFGIFFLSMIINIPIAFCIGLGVLGALVFTTSLPVSIIPLRMYSMLYSFPLLAIPLFVMAGYFMNKSGNNNALN